MKVYCVYDKKTGVYMFPFFSNHDGDAVRMFMSACKTQDSVLGDYPEDFDLYCIAEFDRDCGEMRPLDAKKFLLAGSSVISTLEKGV